ncbi:MAG: hypothetical protein ACXWXT_08305 [Candidatus Binatia bacterium]
MDFTKIKKQYRNQWVLIEFSKLDKHLKPQTGRVIAHAPNKDDVYKALLQTKGKNISVEYCGKVNDDIAVMFSGRQREDIIKFQTFPSERCGLGDDLSKAPSRQSRPCLHSDESCKDAQVQAVLRRDYGNIQN